MSWLIFKLSAWKRLLGLNCHSKLKLCALRYVLRGAPCKSQPLDFWPKIEFLQIFCVRQLVHMINKISKNLALSAIFNISGDDSWGRSKTVKIIMLRVKFRRCTDDAEKLPFYSITVKLTDHFISRFFFWLIVKYLKSSLRKINYDFF